MNLRGTVVGDQVKSNLTYRRDSRLSSLSTTKKPAMQQLPTWYNSTRTLQSYRCPAYCHSTRAIATFSTMDSSHYNRMGSSLPSDSERCLQAGNLDLVHPITSDFIIQAFMVRRNSI